jgi:hypothetical protein
MDLPRIRSLGVFAPFIAGGEGLPAYEKWLGRQVNCIIDNADETQGWEEMVQSAAFMARQFSGSTRRAVVGIPMLTVQGRPSLSRGAAGDYDIYFRAIAREFVARQATHCTIRLGWEFNGRWMPWFAGGDPRKFVLYWRRIVEIFRAESNLFRFDWCATLGMKDMETDQAWPGAEYVDVIGADVYNEWWNSRSEHDLEARWHDEYLWSRFGLQWQLTFARENDKQISFPEWGTFPVSKHRGHGGGDEPSFIEHMANWFDGAGDKIAYHGYFERADVALSRGQHPLSAAAFRRLFGGR